MDANIALPQYSLPVDMDYEEHPYAMFLALGGLDHHTSGREAQLWVYRRTFVPGIEIGLDRGTLLLGSTAVFFQLQVSPICIRNLHFSLEK